MWKQIEEYPNYYVNENGEVKNFKTGNNIKPQYYSNGYTFVPINQNGYKTQILIHRLVLKTFAPCESMDELQVNHKNCIRDDNRLENLEWVTPQENRDYRESLHHTPKAQTIQVDFLDGSPSMTFYSKTECAEYFGVTRKAIDRYLQSNTIRKDRKVQAYFHLIGNTYELNKQPAEDV